MPGSKIPEWISQGVITFSERKNRVLKSVIIGVVVSLNHQIPDDLREALPDVVDILAKILILDFLTYTTTLLLSEVPNTNEDQFHLCRYPIHHPLVSQLKDGYKIHVMRREPPYVKGVELKKWGIHLLYECDDDYEGDEESLKESQQFLSEKLAKFFGSSDNEEADCTSTLEQDDCTLETRHGEEEGMSPWIRESNRCYFISFFLVLSLVFLLLSWLYVGSEI